MLRPRVGQKEPPRLGNTIYYGQELARRSHQDSAVRFVTAKRGPERAQDSAVRFVTAKCWPEKASKTRQYDLLRPRVGQKEPPRLGSTTCYGQTWARKSYRRFVTAKSWPERTTKTRRCDLLRPRAGQKEPPRLGSTICYGQELARKSHQDSAVRFLTAKSWPERATKTRQYDLLRPRVGQKEPPCDLLRPRVGKKEPPRLGSTICCGQEFGHKKSHQDSAVRFVTAKSWPERATKTRQYDLLWPNVGQKEPPRLGSTSCYGQELARKSHQDSTVLFVAAKSEPERATKTRQYDLLPEKATKTRQYDLLRPNVGQEWARTIRQYDLLRPRVGQKEASRFGSTICYGQEWARKNQKDSAIPCVTAKSAPERAAKTRQYDLLRPRIGQKEPPRLGSTICYGQALARRSHQDSAVRFVTAKSWPERATETRQYVLLRTRVGQKKPPRLGSTICYGQELARKSHQDSAVRLVTAKRGPDRAIKTRQYDLLRPRVGQKEPPRLGSTICYGQTWARKSHQDSAVRLVTAKRGPERAIKTRQYDLLRPNVGQKEPSRLGSTICYGQKKPPRLGSTICYGQTWARKSHQGLAVRFVTAECGPERATKTRQYDLLRPNVGQKKPQRLGSTICYGQTWARKSQQDSAVRFVTAKSWPERATETRQYDLLRPRVVQKEPPRLGSTICYGQELARKSHQDSAVRFVTAKRGPERATKIRQYDSLRPNVGQKEPPRLGSTICHGQELARKSHGDSAATKTRQYGLLRPRVGQKEPPRLGSTICYGQELSRKSQQDSAVRFVTAKRGPERATKTRQYDLLRPRVGQKEPPYDLLRPNVGQKEPPRLGSTICYGQTRARKSHQDSAVRFVTAKSWPEKATETRQCYLLRPRVWPERATKTRQYDLLRPNVCQKKPPRLGSTICYGQELARMSHQDSAVRFVAAKSWPKRTTKTRQYDLLRPNVGQKEPPRLGSTICYGQTWARNSHQDSAVRFVTAKSWPERATKTRQYDLLRPRVVCYDQTWARKSHQDSAVRFVTAKSCPERATKTRQYDLLRPRVGQKKPPRLGSTICYGQELARKSHQDSAVRFVRPPRLGSTICHGQDLARKSHQESAVRFVTAKCGPERAIKTRQYDLLRPRVGQKKPPRLGSTICYGQTWARKSHQDSAVRFVTGKSWPERATKNRQYDLLRPNVGQKEPPRLGSTICYGQTWARKSHQDSAVRFVTAKRGPERATKTRQYDLLRPKSWPEKATKTEKKPPRLGSTICCGQTCTKTRQYDLLRPRVGQKEPPRLGSTICYGQTWARKSHQDSAVRFVTANRNSHRDSAVRFVTAKRGPERAQDSAVRFVTAKCWPEKASKTRQYDLLRPRVGQKEPPRLGSTTCYGQTWARKSYRRFVTAKSWPERTTKTRRCDLLRPRVGQKEPPRLGSTICYGQELARKSHQDSAVRFVTAKSWPERATKTRQYDLLRPRVGQKEPPCDLLRPRVGKKEPPRLGSTICCGQEFGHKKSHQDSAVRFVTAKSWPERATKTRQYDLLRPNVGQKEPPRLGSTSCYGQELARKSHQDSTVLFVAAKSEPERATKTRQYDLLPEKATKTREYDLLRPNVGQEWARTIRQYDLLRPRVGQKEASRFGSTICYGQEWARKNQQDSAIPCVTAKSAPERAAKTRQYDLLRPRIGQKEPSRPGSTICYGQTWARMSHQDSAVRFVTAKRGPERATETRQYDLLRPNVGQKEPPRLGSTMCYGQELARKSHQDSAVRFVTAKSWPEKATKTRQYDLLRPNVGQKEPSRLGSTICYGQT